MLYITLSEKSTVSSGWNYNVEKGMYLRHPAFSIVAITISALLIVYCIILLRKRNNDNVSSKNSL